jgi:hypothetical protein
MTMMHLSNGQQNASANPSDFLQIPRATCYQGPKESEEKRLRDIVLLGAKVKGYLFTISRG